MSPTKRKPAKGLFQPYPTDKWKGLRVFPGFINANIDKARQNTIKSLQKMGMANLRFLCAHTGILARDKATRALLAMTVLDATHVETMHCLCEFSRHHEKAILEQYDYEFEPKQRAGHASEIENLSQKKVEPVRILTKLLVMYHQDANVIERIHFRHLWRVTRTAAEFALNKLPKDAIELLSSKTNELIDSLRTKAGGLRLRLHAAHQLEEGPHLFVFQQEYKERAVPDFGAKGYSTQHGYGHVIFAIHDSPARLEIKVGKQSMIDAIALWARLTLNAKMELVGAEPFIDYEANEVEKKLLGEYSEQFGISIIGIKFRRTSSPAHPALSVEAAYGRTSIREALAHYRERAILSLSSLSDIQSMRVHFEGTDGEINVVMEKDGTIRLCLDNSGWPDDIREKVKEVFPKTFGIPLNQRINPKPLSMGAFDIYRSLLEWENADELQSHQQDLFKDLIDRNLVTVQSQTKRMCRSAWCSAYMRVIEDEQIERCPSCKQDIREWTFRQIIQNEPEIRRLAGKTLQGISGLKFESSAMTFDSHKFYQLLDPKRPDQAVCVYFAPRVSMKNIELFDRLNGPVLVIHTAGYYEHAHLEIAAIGHVGFAYILAALREKDTAQKFVQDCQDILGKLRTNRYEGVLRAARASRQRLAGGREGYTGTMYEAEMFNLIRSIFPHTVRWGGGYRPDGFCSLVYSKTNNLAQIDKWNWSYDAKFTKELDGVFD